MRLIQHAARMVQVQRKIVTVLN